MKRKEKYNLNKIDCIADYKISGCGKIIPNTRLIQMKYDGNKVGGREETNKSVVRYILDWLEEEE